MTELKTIIKSFAFWSLFILFLVFIYKCPFRLLFHYPCPGCGLSRAVISFLKGDIKEAFNYHPLFLLAGFEIIYLLFRKKFRLPIYIEFIILIITTILFLSVYIYRIKNGLLV